MTRATMRATSADVRRLGGVPSNKTGDFVEKVRVVSDFRGKLDLLNRGQRWVIRRIEENLATITDPGAARISHGDGQRPLHQYRSSGRRAERGAYLSLYARAGGRLAHAFLWLTAFVTFAIARAGASAETLGAGSHHVEIRYGGLGRSYIVHVPPQASSGKPLPVILNFHGGGSNAEQQERYSGMDATADRDGFIAVYPNGRGVERARSPGMRADAAPMPNATRSTTWASPEPCSTTSRGAFASIAHESMRPASRMAA